MLAIQQWWIGSQQAETIPYSQFEEMIDGGKIQSVHVTDKYITSALKEPLPEGRKQFVTVRVDPAPATRLAEHGISVEGGIENNLIRDIMSGSSRSWSSSAYGLSSSAASPRSRAWAGS